MALARFGSLALLIWIDLDRIARVRVRDGREEAERGKEADRGVRARRMRGKEEIRDLDRIARVRVRDGMRGGRVGGSSCLTWMGFCARETPVVLTTNCNLIDSNKFSSLLEYFNLLIFTGKLLVNIFLLQ